MDEITPNSKLPAGFSHTMAFGKHKDKTLAEIIDIDPQYIIWLHENGVMCINEKVIDMAYEMTDDFHYDWGDWDDTH